MSPGQAIRAGLNEAAKPTRWGRVNAEYWIRDDGACAILTTSMGETLRRGWHGMPPTPCVGRLLDLEAYNTPEAAMAAVDRRWP